MITIKIKIKGKLFPREIQVKTFRELSVKELKQWLDLQREGVKTDIIHYLSIVRGISYKAAYNLNIKNPENLISVLGEVIDYEKAKPAKKIVVDDTLYNVDDISIFTVGQRNTIEENIKGYENEEMLCYILAVAMLGYDSTDALKVKDLKDKLLDCAYVDVLPTAFFLLKILWNGKNSGIYFLKKLLALISIKFKKNRLG